MSAQQQHRPQQGEYTQVVYGWIRDGDYSTAISFLSQQAVINPNSRPCLSLLAYCYYYNQEFLLAANTYEQLTELFPDVEEYRLHYASSLYQASLYEEAMKISYEIEEREMMKDDHSETQKTLPLVVKNNLLKLRGAINYAREDWVTARSFIEQLDDSVDRQINLGCILFREGESQGKSGGGRPSSSSPSVSFVQQALQKFSHSLEVTGKSPDLLYNIALCHYRLKDFPSSLRTLGEIIESGIREHPELHIGSTTEGLEVKSVGNTVTLHETALVEAFNLKAAIALSEAIKNPQNSEGKMKEAIESLTDMPPRSEEELDPVTLHNSALLSMESNPSEGFEKLQFLISQPSFPPETFPNLILLYVKYEYYELAADVMAENTALTYKLLSPYLYSFLDALITQQTSPEEAYQKFDEMSTRYTDQMRKLVAKGGQQEAGGGPSTEEYQEILTSLYLPVLMSQAKIYWDLEMYDQVEKVFRQSAEFASSLDAWKLNVAHVLYMQENKFKEATGFYEPLVKKSYDNILEVPAIVLANLCVSYIMTGANEDAEELMRKIEKEEEQLAYSDSDRKSFHLSIVNLVIGTLYCVKGNYEFGISRVIKSLDPFPKKLGTDTWFYSKRCFLSLLEGMGRQVVTLRDSVIEDCLQFLSSCEKYGQDIKAVTDSPLEQGGGIPPGRNTVSYEARLLKALFIQVVQNKVF